MNTARRNSNQVRRRGYAGLGQLTLVEHALCPLDPAASLVDGLVHHSGYFFMDGSRHMRQAKAKVISPAGLSASDEFYLWGLLALTFAQPEPGGNLFATPHYCLRQLGVIDQHARRGGEQYLQFARVIERLSQVTYLNDRFYDPVRAEHRKVGFGFLSYSLPLDPNSSRAWRIAWDPIFFEIVEATGGSFRFDLATYRDLDPASRRLFLLLCKILSRRTLSPRFDVRHLAVNVLGFSPTLATRNLNVKLWRCVERLMELEVIKPVEKKALFCKTKPGEYSVTFTQGDYFNRHRKTATPTIRSETAVHDLLRTIGFDDLGIVRLLRRFPSAMLGEWVDITLAAKERFGPDFFKKSPQAYLVDNLQNAAKGTRTPPDWWRELQRVERKSRPVVANPKAASAPTAEHLGSVTEESRQAYERIVGEMFGVFHAAGQPGAVAQKNAEKFAEGYLQTPGASLDKPIFD